MRRLRKLARFALLRTGSASPAVPPVPSLGAMARWDAIGDWVITNTLTSAPASAPEALDGSTLQVFQNGAGVSQALSSTITLPGGTYQLKFGIKIAGGVGHICTAGIAHGASTASVTFSVTAGSYGILTHAGWSVAPVWADQGNGFAIVTASVVLADGAISRGLAQWTANSRSTLTTIHRSYVG